MSRARRAGWPAIVAPALSAVTKAPVAASANAGGSSDSRLTTPG